MSPFHDMEARPRARVFGGVTAVGLLLLVVLAVGFAADDRDMPSLPLGPQASESASVKQVDLVVYGATTGGLGTIRGLKLAMEGASGPITVALVSPAPGLESPLAQGLSVEDDYRPGVVGGFYGEFRQMVIRHYEQEGMWPLLRNGRLVYEPEVADAVLRELVFDEDLLPARARGKVEVLWIRGFVREASDEDGVPYVRVEQQDGSLVELHTRYFVDASVEADLARLLGADYRMGRSVHLYNDVVGPQPEPPTEADSFSTAPQSLTMLLTLSVSEEQAEPIRSLPEWDAKAVPGGLHDTLPESIRRSFGTSWSLRHVLPHGKRELNEGWNDWANPYISYEWYRHPEERPRLVGQLQARALHYLALVQEHFPHVGLATLPSWPYVRGEVMVIGDRVFHLDELVERVTEPIAGGQYASFDRHDPYEGTQQTPDSATVEVPLAAVRPADHPYLLVTTALSLDYRTYNSACRMEPVRANVGAACGVQVALAMNRGTSLHDVPYAQIREELLRQGHRHLR